MSMYYLRKHNYKLKHTKYVGWWVDGANGFCVAGYYDDKKTAIAEATDRIKAARSTNQQPVWAFN